RMQLVDQKQPEHRVCRREVDLESGTVRNRSCRLEPRELRIGLRGNVGIEQIVEPYVLRPDAGLERVALAPGAAPMHAEELAGVFESRIPGEHGLEPGDPVAALAGFSVGKPRDAAAERRAQHFEHLPRACQRHAADDVHAARQSSLLFRLTPYLILSRTRKARACRRMCGKYGG